MTQNIQNIIQSVKEEAEKGVEREPLANSGLAGALKVASQKGYIEKDVKKSVNVDQKHKERIRNCVFYYNKQPSSRVSKKLLPHSSGTLKPIKHEGLNFF